MKRVGRAALVLMALSPAGAAAKDQYSWGKAEVSLLQYRTDAVECGQLGASHDIRGAEPTARFLRYFNAQQQVLNGPPGQSTGDYQSIQRLYRPGQRVADVQAMLVSVTERCLVDRGYRRFRLTRDQARTLNRLPKGSPSRHLYLHSLASDQAILARQVP
jgi:hypothetical protein